MNALVDREKAAATKWLLDREAENKFFADAKWWSELQELSKKQALDVDWANQLHAESLRSSQDQQVRQQQQALEQQRLEALARREADKDFLDRNPTIKWALRGATAFFAAAGAVATFLLADTRKQEAAKRYAAELAFQRQQFARDMSIFRFLRPSYIDELIEHRRAQVALIHKLDPNGNLREMLPDIRDIAQAAPRERLRRIMEIQDPILGRTLFEMSPRELKNLANSSLTSVHATVVGKMHQVEIPKTRREMWGDEAEARAKLIAGRLALEPKPQPEARKGFIARIMRLSSKQSSGYDYDGDRAYGAPRSGR